jgi:hypothetical protein
LPPVIREDSCQKYNKRFTDFLSCIDKIINILIEDFPFLCHSREQSM